MKHMEREDGGHVREEGIGWDFVKKEGNEVVGLCGGDTEERDGAQCC